MWLISLWDFCWLWTNSFLLVLTANIYGSSRICRFDSRQLINSTYIKTAALGRKCRALMVNLSAIVFSPPITVMRKSHKFESRYRQKGFCHLSLWWMEGRVSGKWKRYHHHLTKRWPTSVHKTSSELWQRSFSKWGAITARWQYWSRMIS